MKNRTVFLCVILLVGITTHAQQKKPSFSSQVYTGIVTGESATDLQLQTINGVKWDKWFGGIGAGIDWYYYRSIPVFASVSRSLFQKGKRSFMLYGDAGINLPWKQQYFYTFEDINAKQFAGLYWASGFGYKFGLGKADNALLLRLGYSYKKTEERITSTFPCFNPPCLPSTEVYAYKLKRLSLSIGWGF
jgi:hypothetical protein